MLDYRRRLPHWIPDRSVFFLTWRLAGSLPSSGREVLTPERAGRLRLAQQDERLACSASGLLWLRDPRIASMVEQALRYGETVRKLYVLYAWVIMPNHVHVVLDPRLALPEIMRWLKGRTARKANQILGRKGLPLWQDESFDHWVRTADELGDLIRYVERNPVHAGLAGSEEQWPWSSARLADDTKRSSAPPGLLLLRS